MRPTWMSEIPVPLRKLHVRVAALRPSWCRLSEALSDMAGNGRSSSRNFKTVREKRRHPSFPTLCLKLRKLHFRIVTIFNGTPSALSTQMAVPSREPGNKVPMLLNVAHLVALGNNPQLLRWSRIAILGSESYRRSSSAGRRLLKNETTARYNKNSL